MRVLADICRLGAKRFGHRTAIRMGDRTLSYVALDQGAETISRNLRALGVGAGDRVGLFAGNAIGYPMIAFGILKSGATFMPLNFRYQAAELAYVLGDGRPKVLFTDQKSADLARKALERVDVAIRLIVLCGDELLDEWSFVDLERLESEGGGPASLPAVQIDPRSSAVLIYTSGTTGKPKGVLYPHSSYFATFHALIVEGDIAPGEVTLVSLPLFHQAGLFAMILPTWMRGGTVELTSGHFDAAQILETVQRERITLTMWVPTMIARLLECAHIAEYDLSSLGKIYYGSAPMSRVLYEKAVRTFDARFYQWYGTTETGMNAVLRHEDHVQHSAATGREVYNCEIRIVKEGHDVDVGEVGEIYVSAAQHGMLGYLNNEAATAETLVDGWIRTGDLARQDADGLFTVVDRCKDMIISGAENIYPKEIEDVLREHAAVIDAAVFGIPDAVYGEAVCAALVCRQGAKPTLEEIATFCAGRLAGYKRPKKILHYEELPRNALGKVTKQVLRAPFWAGHDRNI